MSLGHVCFGCLAAIGSRRPSVRVRLSLIALATVALALFISAPLSQAKVVVNGFGTAGTLGGQFGQPRGIDVNQTGNGGVPAGTVYVVDSQNRLQRFSPSGAFERIWGFDVVTGGVATFEICSVASECKVGTAAATTANGGQLNNPQGVAVNQSSGHVYVTETGNRRVSEFNADGAFIRAWGWDVVTSGKPNDISADAFEICDTTAGNVADDCKQAAAGANGGELNTNVGYPIVDSSGNVWIPDATNRRIQQFDSTGHFVAAYGYNVDALGGSGTLEKCTSVVSGACQAGTSGSGAGQFGNLNPREVALDSSGNLYALDSTNSRTQKFNSSLTSVGNFGGLALAAYTTGAPEHILAAQGGTRLLLGINNNVSASERQIVEVDLGTEEVKDASLLGSGLTEISGLGEVSASSTVYATTNAAVSPRKVIVLSATPLPSDPVKALDPITVKTDTTATLSGAVDPQGGLVSCKFQYSTNQEVWTDVPEPGCSSLASGGGPQAVSENVTGLVPNTQYFVRLAVSRPLVAGSTKITGVQSFNTNAVPPVVSNVGAVEISNTSIRLVGTVHPRHSATEYVFQYGTTPALESSTTPVAIGSSNAPLVLSQVISGLSPSTEYFFKLVATNAAGQAASETRAASTRDAPLPLPDNRAWEQISLVNKNYNDAELASGGINQLGLTGEGAVYSTFGNFGEPPGQTISIVSAYIARRTDHGWVGGAGVPPFCAFDHNNTDNDGYALPGSHVDANVEHGVVSQNEVSTCPIPPLSPLAPTPAENLYRDTISTEPFALTNFELLTPSKGYNATTFKSGSGRFGGGSDDFSHVVYSSTGQQTPDSPPADGTTRLFDWHDGTLSLISREPITNNPFPGETSFVVSISPLVPVEAGDEFVSHDGDRIFFNYPTSGASMQIYMRENDAVTYNVSASECTNTCGTAAAPGFEAANPDGSRVAFTSTAKLTDEDIQTGKDLYLYTHSNEPQNPGQLNLTLISKDNEPADATGAVQGFYGMSADADTIFFVTNNQLVPGKPTAAGLKLYRWQRNGGSPTITYLATLKTSGEETGRWGAQTNRQVTPSGNDLVLATTTQIDPVADQDTDFDVYRWDAQLGWSCASCQLPGLPSVGPSKTGPLAGLQISDDGTRIPFTSVDALVPADINGTSGCPAAAKNKPLVCQDVYEWHDGAINLISSGLGTTYTKVYGISRSGRDIMFSTRESLVGWDTDENTDFYDARIDGGFPEPPAKPASCEGEACREAGTSAPSGGGAGTAVFEGPSNGSEIVCPEKNFRKVTVKGRTVCKRKRSRHRRPKRHNERHFERGSRSKGSAR